MMFDWIRIAAGGPVTRDYEILKDPITNAQYCVWLNSLSAEEANGHYTKLMSHHFFGGIELVKQEFCGDARWQYVPKKGFGMKPVVFVSWFDAQAYAASIGGRLPTGIEWKKAAAWSPKEGRFAIYCTGQDSAPSAADAVYYDFEQGWTLPAPHLANVDWYKPSGAYGLRGMAGNVGEWVDSDLPNGWKAALGGSLFRPVEMTRLDAGEGDNPQKRLSTFGFRVVRDIS